MGHPDHRSRFALVLVGALMISACTAAATPVPTKAPTAAPSVAAASVAPTATPLPGTKQFTIAKPSASVGNVNLNAAVEALNKAGYNITIAAIDTPELVIEGASKNQFQMGDGSVNAVMNAITKGAAIRVIADRLGNEWSLYTKTDLADCKALAGKNVAITSLGSSVTAMLKTWIAKTCPGTTPNYLIIATSDQRALALIANQIDAAPLQLADGLPLINNAATKGKFKVLTNFQRDLPEVLINTIYVNLEFARDNPGSVVALLKAVLTENRKIADDPAELKTIATKYIPNIDQSSLDSVVAAYREFKLLDVNGGLTTAKADFNAKFYGPAPDGTGSVSKVLGATEWTDLTYLNIVLADIGKR